MKASQHPTLGLGAARPYLGPGVGPNLITAKRVSPSLWLMRWLGASLERRSG
jgi:hypothetical protein